MRASYDYVVVGAGSPVTAGHRHLGTALSITTGYDPGIVVAVGLTVIAILIACVVIRRRAQ